MVDHPDSKLDVEHRARHLSKLQRGPTESPSKSSNVLSSGIAFAALDLTTRPSPLRATMCSSVWTHFPCHVPRCYLSVITPPGTFPATLNITAAPNGKSSPRCGLFFNRSCADLPSLATWHLIRRSVACSTIHGTTDEWTETRLPFYSKSQKEYLIPRSMNPFDCESATGECSNSVPRDP